MTDERRCKVCGHTSGAHGRPGTYWACTECGCGGMDQPQPIPVVPSEPTPTPAEMLDAFKADMEIKRLVVNYPDFSMTLERSRG